MAFRVFGEAGWNGSASVVDLGTLTTVLGTGRYYYYPTFDKAYEGASSDETDTVAPVPQIEVDGVAYGGAFLDAYGFPVQRVDVTMTGSLSLTKSVRVCGGAYRLRLIGGGTRNITFATSGITCEFVDCDFVQFLNCFNRSGTTGTALTLTRCLIAGAVSWGTNTATTTATDCVIVGNQGTSAGALTLTRCTVDIPSSAISSATDCLNIAGMTPTEIAAFGFATSPLAIDSSDSTYFLPDSGGTATAWTNSTWESWDLRLLSTSSYISGGSSVTSGTKAYGLDGLPRKVGGAVGAYEYYAVDAEFIPFKNYQFYRYIKIAASDDGPQPSGAHITYQGPTYGRSVKLWFDSAPPYDIQATSISDDSRTVTVNVTTSGGVTTGWFSYVFTLNRAVKLQYVDADGNVVGDPTYIYQSATKDEGYVANPRFDERGFWKVPNVARFATPTSTSVCYIGGNVGFAGTTAPVGKIILPGWTHANIADVGGGAEAIVGLGATVEFCGEITAKELTETSGELLTRYNPTSGAKFTLDDCATSDASA